LPDFTGTGQARSALFYTLLLTTAGLATASLVVSVLRPGASLRTIAWGYGAVYGVHGIALVLLHLGRLRAAALGYASLLWLRLSALIWVYGCISSQHTVTFIVCILIAGFCAGGRYGILFAGATTINAGRMVVRRLARRPDRVAGNGEPVGGGACWDRQWSVTARRSNVARRRRRKT